MRYPVEQGAGALLRRLARFGREDAASPEARRPRHVRALENVSLTIGPGERVGIIGANGSGKSTFLKAISGCLPPERGRIVVDGRLTSFLNIALGVDSTLSGRDNLALRMLYWDLDPARREDYERRLLEFTELGEFFDLPFKTYSAGMKARLMIGMSLLIEPDILVMDEWIGAGDRAFLAKANERMESFVSSSGILVFATHARPLLLRWSTRLVWIDKGAVRLDGDPRAVLDAYEAATADRPADARVGARIA